MTPRGSADHSYLSSSELRSDLQPPELINEADLLMVMMLISGYSRVLLLLTPPAVNVLMTNNNKDFVSHGATGSLLHRSTIAIDTQTRAHASLQPPSL